MRPPSNLGDLAAGKSLGCVSQVKEEHVLHARIRHQTRAKCGQPRRAVTQSPTWLAMVGAAMNHSCHWLLRDHPQVLRALRRHHWRPAEWRRMTSHIPTHHRGVCGMACVIRCLPFSLWDVCYWHSVALAISRVAPRSQMKKHATPRNMVFSDWRQTAEWVCYRHMETLKAIADKCIASASETIRCEKITAETSATLSRAHGCSRHWSWLVQVARESRMILSENACKSLTDHHLRLSRTLKWTGK